MPVSILIGIIKFARFVKNKLLYGAKDNLNKNKRNILDACVLIA